MYIYKVILIIINYNMRILEVKTVQSTAFRVLIESLKESLTDVPI